MLSSVASLVIRRAVCRSFRSLTPICRPCFSTSISSSVAIRVLTPRTLVRPCSAILFRHAISSTSKAVSPDDSIKRAEKNLLRVLETTIEDAEDSDDGPTQQEVALPEDSPFEIVVDNPEVSSILLKREFQGENIEVRVVMDSDKKEGGGVALPSVYLEVTINKGEGPALEIGCYLDSERLEVESMSVNMAGGTFNREEATHALDGGMCRALRTYLVVRGINPSLYHFLRDYLMNKENKELVILLGNVKEFVAK